MFYYLRIGSFVSLFMASFLCFSSCSPPPPHLLLFHLSPFLQFFLLGPFFFCPLPTCLVFLLVISYLLFVFCFIFLLFFFPFLLLFLFPLLILFFVLVFILISLLLFLFFCSSSSSSYVSYIDLFPECFRPQVACSGCEDSVASRQSATICGRLYPQSLTGSSTLDVCGSLERSTRFRLAPLPT